MKKVRTLIAEHRGLTVEHSDVDIFAPAGVIPTMQGCQHRYRRIHTRREVAKRNTGANWAPARFARQAHAPGQRLHDHVVSGLVAVRAGLAKAADRTPDQSRFALS